MKIKKINSSTINTLTTIIDSMASDTEIVVLNNLDACGCTGNGAC